MFAKLRDQAAQASTSFKERYDAYATKSSIESTSEHNADSPPPDEEEISDYEDSERTEDNYSIQVANADAMEDPEVMRLVAETRQIRQDLVGVKRNGRQTRRRRHQEVAKLKTYKNQKARELWFSQRKSRHFGLNEYKAKLKQCSLPCHDTSSTTLGQEAKLLRAQHNAAMYDHQLEIVQEMQQSMIDYMYNTVVPECHSEQELAAMVGKMQVDKMFKSEQVMVELFEQCLGLQRKIMAKYRMRELESKRGSSDGIEDDIEMENLKMLAGEVPVMERDSELRDSARQRIEERRILQEKRQTRRKSKEIEFDQTTEAIEAVEKEALERAEEQLKRLSNHSVDLNVDEDDNSTGSGFTSGVESGATPRNTSSTNDSAAAASEDNKKPSPAEGRNEMDGEIDEEPKKPTDAQSEASPDQGEKQDEGETDGETGDLTEAESELVSAEQVDDTDDIDGDDKITSGRPAGPVDKPKEEEGDDDEPQQKEEVQGGDEAGKTEEDNAAEGSSTLAKLRAKRAQRTSTTTGVSRPSIRGQTRLSATRPSATGSLGRKPSTEPTSRAEPDNAKGKEEKNSQEASSSEDAKADKVSARSSVSERAAAAARRPLGGARTDLLERAQSARLQGGATGGARPDLLERARSVRVQGGATGGTTGVAGARAGASAGGMSASAVGGARRSIAERPTGRSSLKLGGSEHSARARASLAASPGDSKARLEQLRGGRRSTTATTDASRRPVGGAAGGLSAERRAQLRAGSKGTSKEAAKN